jgi:hypothetical protein
MKLECDWHGIGLMISIIQHTILPCFAYNRPATIAIKPVPTEPTRNITRHIVDVKEDEDSTDAVIPCYDVLKVVQKNNSD